MKFWAAFLLLSSSSLRAARSQGSTCSQDDQCSSGDCGREEALQSAKNVCCESGKVWQSFSMKYVCAGLPTGAACDGENSLCTSGVCSVDNVCLAEKLANSSPCNNDAHCSSGHCGREEALQSAKNVCCESGKVWQSFSMKYVCTGLPTGAASDGDNYLCTSGVCSVDNVCLAEKIANSSPCKNDAHCSSGHCGREEAIQSAKYVCCESEKVWQGFSMKYVCTDLPIGAACDRENSLCTSGVCSMDNVCLAEKIANSSPCNNDAQCASGSCGREEAIQSAKNVCCETGKVWQGFSMKYVCTDLPIGAACDGENSLCTSGVCSVDNVCLAEKVSNSSPCNNDAQCASGSCGREEALQSAKNVCCDSGKVWQGFSMKYVCTGLPVGAACDGANNICTLGVCGVDNVCLAEKVQNESICTNDGQCLSGKCARSEALQSAGYICCSGGSKYINYKIRNVCNERAAGLACAGDNLVCVSGACGADGLCTKQLEGSPCNGSDDDCVNNSCAREEALQTADFVCCPGGEKIDDGSGTLSVCMNVGKEGDACFDDSICQSRVCVSGLCKTGKEEQEGEPCEADDHCASGSCSNKDADGLGSCGPFPSLTVRNEYFNDKAKCPLDIIDASNPNDESTVILQVYGDSFESAWSNSLSNMVTTPKRDQSATLNEVVGEKLLSGIEGCWGGNSVVAQRQGEDICFAYQKEDDDGDGNSDFSCLQKCIKIGGSGKLQTYDKSDTDVIGGVFGTPVSVFYFGETQECRISVEYGTQQATPEPAATSGTGATSTTSTSSAINNEVSQKPTAAATNGSTTASTSGTSATSAATSTTSTQDPVGAAVTDGTSTTFATATSATSTKEPSGVTGTNGIHSTSATATSTSSTRDPAGAAASSQTSTIPTSTSATSATSAQDPAGVAASNGTNATFVDGASTESTISTSTKASSTETPSTSGTTTMLTSGMSATVTTFESGSSATITSTSGSIATSASSIDGVSQTATGPTQATEAGATSASSETPATKAEANENPRDISDILMSANADDTENCANAPSFAALTFLSLIIVHCCCFA